MSAKKVNITKKPTAKDVDEWVTSQEAERERANSAAKKTRAKKKVPMKRLTLDIPEKLHKKLKIQAAKEGRTMADIIREILEEKAL